MSAAEIKLLRGGSIVSRGRSLGVVINPQTWKALTGQQAELVVQLFDGQLELHSERTAAQFDVLVSKWVDYEPESVSG